MFIPIPLDTPETLKVPGGTLTLTHKRATLQINAADPHQSVVLREMKGVLDDAGNFQDIGDHVVSTMDLTGLSELLANTAGGKRAGVFRTDDIKPAIAARQAEIKAQAAPKP